MKAILCTWDTFNLSAWNSLLLKECKFILLERWFTFVVEHQWTKHCEFICSCLRIVNKVKIITYLRVLLKSWEYSQSSEPIYLPNSLEGREMLASSVARPFPFHVKLRTLVSWNCISLFFIYLFLSEKNVPRKGDSSFSTWLFFVPKNQHLSQEVGIAFSFFMLRNPYTVKTLDWKFKKKKKTTTND